MNFSKILSFICLLCLLCIYNTTISIASGVDLQKALKEKQNSSKKSKTLIEELTQEERKTRADLAKSEKSIKELENDIAKQQKNLSALEQKERQIKYHLAFLKKQQLQREKSIAKLLNTLWPLQLKRYSLDSGEDTIYKEERDYIWLQYVMSSIDKEHEALEKEKEETQVTLELQRNNYIGQKEVTANLKNQLQTLLAISIEYNKKIQAIRMNRKTAEEELKDIVKVIISIENQLQEKRNVGKIVNASKGKLPWPVDGKMVVSFKPKASPPIKGVGFVTKKNANIKAVADGTIVHSDILRGFGKVIILSHGNLYYSVYAFLSSTSLPINSTVKQGTILGKSGFYPAVDTSGLYFELRKNETTINPSLWLKK